jgi:hypothetical protein
MYITIGNMLRTTVSTHPPRDVTEADEIVDSSLASAQYAICAAIHRTLQIPPGALVFQRDMLLPIPIIADCNNLSKTYAAVSVTTNLEMRF